MLSDHAIHWESGDHWTPSIHTASPSTSRVGSSEPSAGMM